MIINLQWSRLGIDNLDKLFVIPKNWLDDAHVGCEGRKLSSFSEFIEDEDTLLEDYEKLIFDCGFFRRK